MNWFSFQEEEASNLRHRRRVWSFNFTFVGIMVHGSRRPPNVFDFNLIQLRCRDENGVPPTQPLRIETRPAMAI